MIAWILRMRFESSHPDQRGLIVLSGLFNGHAFLCLYQKNVPYSVPRFAYYPAGHWTVAHGVPIESVSKMSGHRPLLRRKFMQRLLKENLSVDMRALKGRIKENKADSYPELKVLR